MKNVVIYSADWCNFCSKAKTLMKDKGWSVNEKDIDEEDIAHELKERFPEAKTIPQIIVDGHHVGGYTDLLVYLDIQ